MYLHAPGGTAVQRIAPMKTLRLLGVSCLLLAAIAAIPGGTATAQTPPTPIAASPADTSRVIAQVQSFYEKTQTFASDFAQEFTVKAYNQKKQSRGHVVFAKPGKMDWVYAEPKDNRIVSDGEKLKVYEAANKQMYEQAVQKSQYPAALSFLTGQGKLEESFKFQMFDGASMSFPGGRILVGTPKTPTPAYEKVLFYVDKGTSQVRRVLIIDGQGNRNRFDFLNPKVNEAVPPSQFTFTPPPGTTVIRP
jgi:outer membrane lipoprotein carrier protein